MPANCRTVAARRPILAFRYANNEQTMTATELKAIIVNRSRYRILIFGRVPHKIFSQFAQNTVECVLKMLLTVAINGLHCESNIADGTAAGVAADLWIDLIKCDSRCPLAWTFR